MNKSSALQCNNFLKQFINYKRFPLFEFDNLIDCEAAKILENSYRAINIAFIDEWTKYANATKLNLNRVINAIKKRKTHNNIMSPGLGVGGYCITKDPDFINFSTKFFSNVRFNFPITNIAKKINESMPNTSINFIKSKIKNLRKKKILILGAAYKQDVSDTRYSPTVNLINYFKRKKINFSIHDPVIDIEEANKFSVLKKLPNLNNYNVILFCVGHSYYKNIRIKKLPKKPIYFDLNRVLSFSQIKLIKKRKLKLEILGGNY
jgi:nucleotide sugar dehydrogenase